MIDFEALTRAVIEGAEAGLLRGAQVVERRAKQRAPVRNIFGRGYRFRAKTGSEMQADLRILGADAATQNEPGSRFGTRWVGPKRVRADMRERGLGAAREHLAAYEEGADTPLTRRGAYEVRTMRAAHISRSGETHIGGRLRGEIFTSSIRRMGEGMSEVMVISPTPYAKYQEFGTRHNRAHPFLRPALEESRGDIRAQVASAVAEASRKGLGSVQLEIHVRL